ncbi:hypothetical protein JXB41_08650 [Candidatus Woesearchaeota archaeon]|nr:hypothetical protein [Candidatus Woesearchaeota archaeon]
MSILLKTRLILRKYLPEWLKNSIGEARIFIKRHNYFAHGTKYIRNYSSYVFKKKNRKKVLGIWNLNYVPWSIGDFLSFVQTLNVLKLKKKAEGVDICLICDVEKIKKNKKFAKKSNVTIETYDYYIMNLIPIAYLSPYLCNLFIYTDEKEYFYHLNFIEKNTLVYPSIKEQFSEKLSMFNIGATLFEITDFFKKNNYLPQFKIPKYNLFWAKKFYKKYLGEKIPIVVNLRLNPYISKRNANIRAWKGFFKLCQKTHPGFTFVIIGTREEINSKIAKMNNVIYAKEKGSSFLDDCALISTSFLFMGSETGMSEIIQYTTKPYLMFNRPKRTAKIMGLKTGENFKFATKLQKVFYIDDFIETKISIYNEFKKIINKLDENKWKKTTFTDSKTVYSHVVRTDLENNIEI